MRMKTEARRQAIMRAALSVFDEVGYERASMAEIAARLGGSKVTLYSYFDSKEDLFATAMLEAPLEQAAHFQKKLDTSRDDFATVLEEFGVAYLEFQVSADLLNKKRSAMAQGANSSLGPTLYERGPRQSSKKVAAYLAHLMDRGVLRDADPRIAALHLQGLLEAGVVEPRLYGATPDQTIDKAAALAIQVFLLAYMPTDRVADNGSA